MGVGRPRPSPGRGFAARQFGTRQKFGVARTPHRLGRGRPTPTGALNRLDQTGERCRTPLAAHSFAAWLIN